MTSKIKIDTQNGIKELELEIKDRGSYFFKLNLCNIENYNRCIEYYDEIKQYQEEFDEVTAAASIDDAEKGKQYFALTSKLASAAKKIATICLAPTKVLWEDVEEFIAPKDWISIATWCIEAYASYLKDGLSV